MNILQYINEKPEHLSLLYDKDLLPEQTEKGSFQERQMLILSNWHQQKYQPPLAEAGSSQASSQPE